VILVKHDCIFAILARGEADRVMDSAKKAGAKGGTIFLARGTGSHEAKTFFGLTLETGREILMILCDESETDTILQAVLVAGKLREPGAGIAFVLPVTKAVGLQHRQGIERSNE
jgi:nitrogen regulatory protein P-II 1